MRLGDSYATELEGLHLPWQAPDWPAPDLVMRNDALADQLGLDRDSLTAALLTGQKVPAAARPVAMAYAGHQFGGFSPQLGDGRAVLLGEITSPDGRLWDLHLKGSGRTPFARGGDGRAVLGPVLREYLISEAMAALGIPTTRALAVCTTGDRVLRQNGMEPGAVLARIASSHLRVGSFQFAAARGDVATLRRLLAHAIKRHDPDLAAAPDAALQLLHRVAARQVRTVAQWMGVGFVHGVMNTDNTTISGETIDYGPCAFMDRYDPATCFSSIDHAGRYAYGNQPAVIFWNLARLAEALLPLIDPNEDRAIAAANDAIAEAQRGFEGARAEVFSRKLGLAQPDRSLVDGTFALLKGQGVDFTLFFRALPEALRGDETGLRALFADDDGVSGWLAQYRQHADEDTPARVAQVNPIFIPRNHLVEDALHAASFRNDLAPFRRLLEHVQAPFTPAGPESAPYAQPAPPERPAIVTYCGT